MYNCPICVIFMAAPSVTIQEKQRMLRDQNAMDVTQYIKERSNLEGEMSHYHYFVVFLDMKAIARNNQDIDHRKGNYKYHAMNTKWVHTIEGLKILFHSF